MPLFVLILTSTMALFGRGTIVMPLFVLFLTSTMALFNFLKGKLLYTQTVSRDVAKAWKLGGGGGVCAYLPDLKNIFEIYLNI